MSLWDRVRAGLRRRPPPHAPPASPPMHWRPNPVVAAVACRAEGFLFWTGDIAAATCDECAEAGKWLVLQKEVSTR